MAARKTKKTRREPGRKKASTPLKASGGKKAAAKKASTKKASTKKASTKTSPKKTSPKKASPKKPTGKALTKQDVAEKRSAKPVMPRKAPTPRATVARDALTALAQKRTISAALSPIDDATVVDAYLRDVDHPFKAEMQSVRQIILGASPKIAERIKWNAPSFHYKEDLGAFNPRATEYAHLILLFPGGTGLPADDRWLEGKHKDRREAKFYSLEDVAKKKPALEKLVKRWVALRDE